jgi:hypothetical protein
MLTSKGSRNALLVLAVIALAIPSVSHAGLFGSRKDKPADKGGMGGDLAIIDLRVHEVRTGGSEPRLVAQALVENQKPINRIGPYELQVRRKDSRETLGTCRGEALPQGQVALCELWLMNESVKHGDVFEAALNRSVGDFNSWDADPTDDRRTYEVRTIGEGNQVLRLAEFQVVPQTIQGVSEVQFRFQVDGAHLVWLLAEDRPPRLLAGHPADGPLQGKGKERLSTSGPLILVARNSFGSFVYQTIPVINTYQQAAYNWSRVPPQAVDGSQTMKVLDPGVYDVDEDQVILEHLRAYLASKDWNAAVERLRNTMDSDRPQPASVLNPKARPKPRAAAGQGAPR